MLRNREGLEAFLKALEPVHFKTGLSDAELFGLRERVCKRMDPESAYNILKQWRTIEEHGRLKFKIEDEPVGHNITFSTPANTIWKQTMNLRLLNERNSPLLPRLQQAWQDMKTGEIEWRDIETVVE